MWPACRFFCNNRNRSKVISAHMKNNWDWVDCNFLHRILEIGLKLVSWIFLIAWIAWKKELVKELPDGNIDFYGFRGSLFKQRGLKVGGSETPSVQNRTLEPKQKGGVWQKGVGWCWSSEMGEDTYIWLDNPPSSLVALEIRNPWLSQFFVIASVSPHQRQPFSWFGLGK